MHPGPMNRGVEIDSPVADGPQSVIMPQVTFGIAVRMAVMSMLGSTRMKTEIRGARVVDPAANRDEAASIFVADGRIAGVGRAPDGWRADETIEAAGLVACPGLVDLSARLREPGYEYKATLESEMAAAVAGGVTTLACPPDTDPPLDEPGLVEMLTRRAAGLHGARVHPLGALTTGLKGQRLAEMAELAEAGCVGFFQGNAPLAGQRDAAAGDALRRDVRLHRVAAPAGPGARRGRRRPRGRGRHAPGAAADPGDRGDGRGAHHPRADAGHGRARAPGAPLGGRGGGAGRAGEGARRAAHLRRLRASSASLRPRHRRLRFQRATWRPRCATRRIASACAARSPRAPSTRPARTTRRSTTTRSWCRSARPSPAPPRSSSCCPWCSNGDGNAGSALPATLAAVTLHPARVLGVAAGSLAVGVPADICLFDPKRPWIVKPAALASQGKNTPFMGLELTGRVVRTLVAGRTVHAVREPAHEKVAP